MIEFRTQIKLNSDVTIFNVWESFCNWNLRNRTSELIQFLRENTHNLFSGKKVFLGKTGREEIETDYNESKKILYIIFTQEHKNGDTYKNSIVYDGNIQYLSFEADTINGESKKYLPYSTPKFFYYLKPYIDKNCVPDKCIESKDIGIKLLAKMMKGEVDLKLPLVYISSNKDNSILYFDCELNALAEKLFGMAYISIESDYNTCLELKKETSDFNPYDGVVGVYWNGERKKLFNKPIESIVYEVRKITRQRSLDENLTTSYAINKMKD